MTAMLRATQIKEENVMGFHVEPHYISQQPAFDVATCHIHFSLKQHQEKQKETDIYRHICFVTQILHTSRSSHSRSLHFSTISYSKNNTFQTLETFIFLGERVGRCMCLGLTDGAVSITEPVSDSSLCQTQVSRCLQNLSLDGNRSSLVTCSLFVSIHSTMHKSRSQHSI
jgi:hypothetical protein